MLQTCDIAPLPTVARKQTLRETVNRIPALQQRRDSERIKRLVASSILKSFNVTVTWLKFCSCSTITSGQTEEVEELLQEDVILTFSLPESHQSKRELHNFTFTQDLKDDKNQDFTKFSSIISST